MDESELRSALRAADRRRPTTPDERHRLRQKLVHGVIDGDSAEGDSASSVATLDAAAAAPVTATRPSSLALGQTREVTSRTRTRRAAWLVPGAAATIVVVALALVALTREAPPAVDVPVATMPAPSTGAELRELCAGPIAALDTALAQWGSVADWTVALDGRPDLALLTADALAGLASLDPDLQELADKTRDVVAERASFDLPPGPVVDDHAVVVRAGLLGVIETVARFDPDGVCDLPAIRAELAGR